MSIIGDIFGTDRMPSEPQGWPWPVIVESVPNPGSKAAVKKGCRCAVMDNRYGKGYHFDEETGAYLFVVNFDCPLHGETPK